MPRLLAAEIVATSASLTTRAALGEVIPGAVATLVTQTLKEILVTKVLWTALMLMALVLPAIGAVALVVDRGDRGGEKTMALVRPSDTVKARAASIVTGQTSRNGNQLRVAADRYAAWIDTVWWFGTVDSPTVGYQRNGVGKASFTVPGAIYPDCDMDDWGNSYIVYQAPDPNIDNNPSIYLVVNFLPPVKVSGTAGGVNPTVTVCRGKGPPSINNGCVAIAWNSGTVGGSGHYPAVMAATFSFANGVYLGPQGLTTQPFTVNAPIPMSTYSPPDISSDIDGNYAITYSRSGATSSNGVCAARYQANSSIPLFPKTVLAVLRISQQVRDLSITLSHISRAGPTVNPSYFTMCRVPPISSRPTSTLSGIP